MPKQEALPPRDVTKLSDDAFQRLGYVSDMRSLILIFALLTVPAFAAFDPVLPRPDLKKMKTMIEGESPGDALAPLHDFLVNEPKDADILNLLGYAYRKLQRYDQSRIYYDRALAVEPAHLGALEYLGELELETSNPDAAKALLIRLQAACPDGCHELDDLIEAFAQHGIPTAN